MQRLRGSPQGSVLGSLNALFSPHPVTGAPSPAQAASQGLLGRVARQTVQGSTVGTGGAAQQQQAAQQRALSVGGGGGGGGLITGAAIARASGGGGGGNQGLGTGLFKGIGPGILGIGTRTATILGLGAAGLGALPALGAIGGAGLIGGLGAGVLGAGFKIVQGQIGPLAAAQAAAQQRVASATTPAQLKSAQATLANVNAQIAQLSPALQSILASETQIKNTWKAFAIGLAPLFVGPVRQVATLLTQLTGPLHQLFAGAATLAQPLISGMGNFAKQVLPLLASAFRAVAPLIRPLLDGLTGLVTGLLPGLITLLRAGGPALNVFAQVLGTLGKDLGIMLAEFAPVIKPASAILKALLDVVSALFPIIGKLAAIFANALAPVFITLASVLKSLLPFLVIIGKVIGDLAGAILGDLVAAFTAIAQLLIAVSPALAAFAKAISGVFTVLENSGVFAILGDALEALVKPLATLISALLRGLTPLLPPIITFISALSGILIGALVKAVLAILPPLTQLATVALQSIALILPVILPLLLTFAAIFTTALVTVISDLATSLSFLINAVPPSVLKAVVIGILAIVGALKVWAIAQAALDLVLSANPIGLIIIALAALGVAIFELVKHWRQVWGEIRRLAEDAWHFLTHVFRNGVVQDILAVWSLGLIPLAEHWRSAWAEMKQIGKDFWQWIWADFGAKIKNFLVTTIPSWFNIAVSNISSFWNKIKGVITAPVRFVIDDVLDGIISVFDTITNAVGLGKPIPQVHPFGLAAGGRIPGFGGGDRYPALLEGGETVVDKQRSALLAPLFKAMGVPGYAGGGTVPLPGGHGGGVPGRGGTGIGGFISKALDVGKMALAFATGNSAAFTNAFADLLGKRSGAGGIIGQILAGIPKLLVTDLVNWIMGKSAASAKASGGYGSSAAAAGRAGGGVQQWASLVLRALAMEHLPLAYLNDVLYQMQTESGGRANAINLTDINAQLGDPSRGLMQVIMATFRMWHWPGTSWNIYDPLANIAAALNYAEHGKGFGPGAGQIGSGHGYAKGGKIREPVIGFGTSTGQKYTFGEKGDEWVTPAGPGGSGPGGSLAHILNIMLPEGGTLAQAFAELSFRLRVAQQQGWAGSMPGG